MARWQRFYLAVCGGVLGFAIAYVLSDAMPLPRLTHYQHEAAWRWVERAGSPIPSSYVGMVLWAAVGAAVGAATGWGIAALVRSELPDRWVHLLGGWALTATAFASVYFLWNLWPFS